MPPHPAELVSVFRTRLPRRWLGQAPQGLVSNRQIGSRATGTDGLGQNSMRNARMRWRTRFFGLQMSVTVKVEFQKRADANAAWIDLYNVNQLTSSVNNTATIDTGFRLVGGRPEQFQDDSCGRRAGRVSDGPHASRRIPVTTRSACDPSLTRPARELSDAASQIRTVRWPSANGSRHRRNSLCDIPRSHFIAHSLPAR